MEKVVVIFCIQKFIMFKVIIQNRVKSCSQCGGIVKVKPYHSGSSQRTRQQDAFPQCAWPLAT